MTSRTSLAATLLSVAATAAIGDAPEHTGGQAIYDRCIACHAIDRNRTGPLHCGLFGRKAGAAPGFALYSDAMRNSGIVWNARTLERFLRDPAAMVPGTTMGYAGIADARERTALIDWLLEATRAGARCTVPGAP
ncbi:MAG: cytochrome C [Rhodoferax sp.]|nr:cytochrome C [Rhodoferax sp.]